ncbi:MAG TPA: polysaccharide biosynthesis tyrosine autokinase [Acidimicrobiia bacterium]|nr:polysaccharide biosynthesis tyrosine autokinase [Acidimicrobiia bacterium]
MDEQEQAQAGAAEEPLFNFDLKRYLDALRRYGLAVLALVAVVATGAVVYTSRLPKQFEAKASVQIEPRLPDLLGQGAELLAMGAGGADYYRQQKQVLSSYTVTRQTVEQNQLQLKLLNDAQRATLQPDEQLDVATEKLQSAITIKYPDQDRIMYVYVRNEDPQFAAQLANWQVSTYIDYTKNLLNSSSKTASDVLSKEFETEENNLSTAEKKIYQFEKDNDLLAVSLENQQSLVSGNITLFTQKQDEARAHRIEIDAKLARMKDVEAHSPDLVDSPILLMGETVGSFDSLRAQYYTERNTFQQLEKEVGPKHIDFQKQKAKVDDLFEALQSEAKRIIGGVEEAHEAAVSTEKALNDEVEHYRKEAFSLGPKIIAYNELLRDKKSIEDRYMILRNRLSTSEMTERMNTSSDSSYAKKLDPALPPTAPVAPDARVNAMLAGGIALVIGLGLLFLVVFLDRSIKSTNDAQQASGAPVLGIIPMLSANDLSSDDDRARDLYVSEHPTSSVAECCRSLRTNVLFSSADRKLKTIVVSSANPREGKTTNVIYLGTTMAQSGKRVLLVDTDMRRPRLHDSMKVSRTEGLSNLILGDHRYDEVIKPTEIENLFVLPCGPTPPNPAELLLTKRFQTVLAELESRFDMIVLDSPPLQPVTDAVVLAKQADGVIFVVRAGKTQREEIKRSTRQLRNVGGTIIGVVLNEFDARGRDTYYYNYYGYREPAEKPGKPDKAA